MNKTILIGRITKDPEVRQVGNSQCVNFTLAVNRRFKNKDGNNEADFINCVTWAGSANFMSQYVRKGNLLAVEGSIETRNYEKDGQKVYITEVRCENVNLLESAKKESKQTFEQVYQQTPEVDTRELPFY